jgi:hypothetical protein
MRKMIAALAVMSVSSICAAEELRFGDVNYFLKQGQYNLTVDANVTYYRESTTSLTTKETNAYVLETRVGYAHTDQLNFYVGMDAAFDARVTDRKVTANSAYYQSGFSNPILAANYRLLNQNSSLFNLDFGAVAKVKTQDSRLGSATGNKTEDGNFANPRSSVELNARMGKKWDEANEWQLAAGFIYNNAGEFTSLDTSGGADTEVTLDSSTDLFLRATYQYRPVDEFMMALSAQATSIGEVTGEYGASSLTQNAHVDMDFLYRAKYLILDNLTANFHYGMSRNENYGQDIAGANRDVKQRRENYYGFGIDYLF